MSTLRFAVLGGSGGFGFVLGRRLALLGHAVDLIDYNLLRAQSNAAKRRMEQAPSAWMKGVEWPEDNFQLLHTSEATSRAYDFTIVATPFDALPEALQEPCVQNAGAVVLVQKGMSIEGLLPSTIAKKLLPTGKPVLVFTGAAISRFLVEDSVALLVVGCSVENSRVANQFAQSFQGSRLRIAVTEHSEALEMANVIRTVTAIQLGVTDGYGEAIGNPNQNAALVATQEMEAKRILRRFFGSPPPEVERVHLADQRLCSCQESRNYRFGYILGREQSLRAAKLDLKGETVEGIRNQKALRCRLNRSYHSLGDHVEHQYPHLFYLSAVIEEEMTLPEAIRAIESRPKVRLLVT